MRRAALTIVGTVAGLAILLGFKAHPIAAVGTAVNPADDTRATETTAFSPVQVTVTTSGGQVTDVAVVQGPWGDHVPAETSRHTLPTLIQEARTGQSASIDMVSGATYTSHGYVTSLQSVLDQIHA